MAEVKCGDRDHASRASEPEWFDGVLAIASRALPDYRCDACARITREVEEAELDLLSQQLELTRDELNSLSVGRAGLRALGKLAGKVTGVR